MLHHSKYFRSEERRKMRPGPQRRVEFSEAGPGDKGFIRDEISSFWVSEKAESEHFVDSPAGCAGASPVYSTTPFVMGWEELLAVISCLISAASDCTNRRRLDVMCAQGPVLLWWGQKTLSDREGGSTRQSLSKSWWLAQVMSGEYTSMVSAAVGAWLINLGRAPTVATLSSTPQ